MKGRRNRIKIYERKEERISDKFIDIEIILMNEIDTRSAPMKKCYSLLFLIKDDSLQILCGEKSVQFVMKKSFYVKRNDIL